MSDGYHIAGLMLVLLTFAVEITHVLNHVTDVVTRGFGVAFHLTSVLITEHIIRVGGLGDRNAVPVPRAATLCVGGVIALVQIPGIQVGILAIVEGCLGEVGLALIGLEVAVIILGRGVTAGAIPALIQNHAVIGGGGDRVHPMPVDIAVLGSGDGALCGCTLRSLGCGNVELGIEGIGLVKTGIAGEVGIAYRAGSALHPSTLILCPALHGIGGGDGSFGIVPFRADDCRVLRCSIRTHPFGNITGVKFSAIAVPVGCAGFHLMQAVGTDGRGGPLCPILDRAGARSVAVGCAGL